MSGDAEEGRDVLFLQGFVAVVVVVAKSQIIKTKYLNHEKLFHAFFDSKMINGFVLFCFKEKK